jgi:hypothetical protein
MSTYTQYNNIFLNLLEKCNGLKAPTLGPDPNLNTTKRKNQKDKDTKARLFWYSLYMPPSNLTNLFLLDTHPNPHPHKTETEYTWNLTDYYLYKMIYDLHSFITYDIDNYITSHDEYESKYDNLYTYYVAKTKLSSLHQIIENPFLPTHFKDTFLQRFSKAQAHYAALSRFASLCKLKMAKIVCNTDMYMNTLSTKDPRVYQVLHYNTKYVFTMSDLMHMINSALTHLSYFYIEILPIKNPYNNKEFTYTELIQIYFFMKKHGFKVSHLFTLFYEANMDASVFEYDNESYIKTVAIKNYAFNSSYENLYEDIEPMLLVNYTYTKRLSIHPDFPRNKLVDIFRPYLHLFYLYKYFIHGSTKSFESKRILMDKLKRFVKYNMQFGRKYITRKNKEKPVFLFAQAKDNESHVFFNTKHVPFHEGPTYTEMQPAETTYSSLHGDPRYEYVEISRSLNESIFRYHHNQTADEADGNRGEEEEEEDVDAVNYLDIFNSRFSFAQTHYRYEDSN